MKRIFKIFNNITLFIVIITVIFLIAYFLNHFIESSFTETQFQFASILFFLFFAVMWLKSAFDSRIKKLEYRIFILEERIMSEKDNRNPPNLHS